MPPLNPPFPLFPKETVYAYVCVCTHIYIKIYVYTCIYMHMYINVYIFFFPQQGSRGLLVIYPDRRVFLRLACALGSLGDLGWRRVEAGGARAWPTLCVAGPMPSVVLPFPREPAEGWAQGGLLCQGRGGGRGGRPAPLMAGGASASAGSCGSAANTFSLAGGGQRPAEGLRPPGSLGSARP